MKKVTKFNFRTLLGLLLSLTLCLTLAFSAIACGNDSNSSSSSSVIEEEEVNPTDAQKIVNGDFEFSTFTKDNDDFPVSSSISWSRSSDSITNSAVSSSYVSGIINTNDEAYAEIAEKAGFHKNADETYFNPKTPYAYGFVSAEETYAPDEPAEGEAYAENEDGLPMQGDKVLMIHNEVKSAPGEGTAQKFTSSTSISLAKNEYAKLSVWVLTHDLVSAYENEEFGAYIAVQNTAGNSAAPFVIKNINTNSNWAKYTIYLSASDFTTSSFKVVLGLGFGSGDIRREYVEGFAYFDNVHYETVTREEYLAGVNSAETYSIYDSNNELVDDLVANQTGKTFVDNNTTDEVKYTNTVYSLTHTRANSAVSGVAFSGGEFTDNNYLADQATGVHAIDTMANALTAAGLTSEDANPVANGNALYFVHSTPTSSSYVTEKFTVEEGEYLKLSFWVKASTKYPNDNGLTITLNDLGKGSDEAVDTVIASSVKTDEYENENFNDWCEYVVYVSNTLDTDSTENTDTRTFTLTFDFGTTAKSLTNGVWDLTEGYAIVSDFSGYYLSENDYAIADVSTYAYAKKVALSADKPNGVESDKENVDSYGFTYGANDALTVEQGGVATNVINYTGVVGNSKFVGGSEATAYSHEDVVAGLVNSEYYTGLDLSGLNIGTNEYAQPLMIQTKGTTSFGYVGKTATLAANSTILISIKVKVIGDATAHIYLVNSNALDGFNVLALDAKGKKLNDAGTEIVDDESGNAYYSFDISVSSSDMVEEYMEDGWLTVRLLITTGDEAISYRTELWNGERHGAATSGTVLFDSYSTYSYVATDLRNELALDYPNATITKTEFTRVPTTITYTNDDGEEATKFKTYQPTTVVEEYAECKTVIIDLTTIDAVTEIDNTTSDSDVEEDTSEETTSEEVTSFSWALQISSIIIAGVLIALLVVVLVKMLIEKHRKNKGVSSEYYNRNSREKAGLEIEAKKARQAKEAQNKKSEEIVEATEEEVPAYDYDNIENNIESEEAENQEASESEDNGENA